MKHTIGICAYVPVNGAEAALNLGRSDMTLSSFLEQHGERDQHVFAGADLQHAGLCGIPAGTSIELFAEKGDERLQLRNRCLEQFARCDCHRRLRKSQQCVEKAIAEVFDMSMGA